MFGEYYKKKHLASFALNKKSARKNNNFLDIGIRKVLQIVFYKVFRLPQNINDE